MRHTSNSIGSATPGARRLVGLVAVVGILLCRPTAAAADVVLDWNAVALATTLTQNPFAQARFLAITQLAVFEAVNTATGQYHPYLGILTAPTGASAEAAAVAAAHGVLKHYFPGAAAMLDAARENSLGAIPDGWAKDAGIALGQQAAEEMIAARLNDGSAPPQFALPGSTEPGAWQLTPGCPPAGGVFAHWAHLTPFGIPNAVDLRADPPPALTSARYTKDYVEVMSVGRLNSATRAQDRADVARFYGLSATPSYVANYVARQLATAQQRSLADNAHALALINMAVSDGAVVTFETKYNYNFWRPETAIRAGASDGNPGTTPDPSWTPFITTPCFPGYTSNHAGASYAGAEILRRIYGAAGHSIVMSHPNSSITLQYTKLKDIMDDIDDARVYGGVHFRFDQEEGARLGREVATNVYANNLRRIAGED